VHVDLPKVNVQFPGCAVTVERARESHGSAQYYTYDHEQTENPTRIGDMRIDLVLGVSAGRGSGLGNVVGEERDSYGSV
jgi:hypothetical protein